MDYSKASHWDRIDQIIKTLIYKGMIKSDTELYQKLNVDRSSASLIRTRKRRLPKKARTLLFNIYDINEAFLTKGLLPIFNNGEDPTVLDQTEIEFLKNKIAHQDAIIKELRQILKDGLRLSEEDLKNKGLI